MKSYSNKAYTINRGAAYPIYAIVYLYEGFVNKPAGLPQIAAQRLAAGGEILYNTSINVMLTRGAYGSFSP